MTYQRPAYEQVSIALGGNTVMLRPSLRAAASLEARHGFPALVRALDDLNLTIISEILTATAHRQVAAAAFLDGHQGKPLLPFFTAVRQPLTQLISMFMPAAVQKLDATPRSGKPPSWPEFYADQYEKATGWLGWTPEQAWNATPTEIDRAYWAFVDRSRWLAGGDEANPQPTRKAADLDQAARNVAEGLDPDFDRAGLRALKAKMAGGA